MPVFIFMDAYACMSERLWQCTLDLKIKKTMSFGNYWSRSFKQDQSEHCSFNRLEMRAESRSKMQ